MAEAVEGTSLEANSDATHRKALSALRQMRAGLSTGASKSTATSLIEALSSQVTRIDTKAVIYDVLSNSNLTLGHWNEIQALSISHLQADTPEILKGAALCTLGWFPPPILLSFLERNLSALTGAISDKSEAVRERAVSVASTILLRIDVINFFTATESSRDITLRLCSLILQSTEDVNNFVTFSAFQGLEAMLTCWLNGSVEDKMVYRNKFSDSRALLGATPLQAKILGHIFEYLWDHREKLVDRMIYIPPQYKCPIIRLCSYLFLYKNLRIHDDVSMSRFVQHLISYQTDLNPALGLQSSVAVMNLSDSFNPEDQEKVAYFSIQQLGSLWSRKDCQDVAEKICYIASHYLKRVSPGHQLVLFGKLLAMIQVVRQSFSRCRSILKSIRAGFRLDILHRLQKESLRDYPDTFKTDQESIITHLLRSRHVEKFLSHSDLVDTSKSVIQYKEEISEISACLLEFAYAMRPKIGQEDDQYAIAWFGFSTDILVELQGCLAWDVQNRLSVVDSYMNLLTFICSNVNEVAGKNSNESEAAIRNRIRQNVDSLINKIANILENRDSMSTDVLMRIVWVVGHFVAPDIAQKSTISLVFKGAQELFNRLKEDGKGGIEKACIFEVGLCVVRHLSELSINVSLEFCKEMITQLENHKFDSTVDIPSEKAIRSFLNGIGQLEDNTIVRELLLHRLNLSDYPFCARPVLFKSPTLQQELSFSKRVMDQIQLQDDLDDVILRIGHLTEGLEEDLDWDEVIESVGHADPQGQLLSGSSDPCLVYAQHLVISEEKCIVLKLRICNISDFELRRLEFTFGLVGWLASSQDSLAINREVSQLSSQESVVLECPITVHELNVASISIKMRIYNNESGDENDEREGLENAQQSLHLLPYDISLTEFLVPMSISNQFFEKWWSSWPFSSKHQCLSNTQVFSLNDCCLINSESRNTKWTNLVRPSRMFMVSYTEIDNIRHSVEIRFMGKTWFGDQIALLLFGSLDVEKQKMAWICDTRTNSSRIMECLNAHFDNWFKGLSYGKLEKVRPYQGDTELIHDSQYRSDEFSENEDNSLRESLLDTIEDMAISYWV